MKEDKRCPKCGSVAVVPEVRSEEVAVCLHCGFEIEASNIIWYGLEEDKCRYYRC